MQNKKGAIELSMTTIIVIILGVTLLSLGLMFIKGTFGNITDITDKTFDQADDIIKDYMVTGTTKMYILDSNVAMKAGTINTIYVGIKNQLGRDDEFYLKAKPANDKSDVGWLELATEPQTIEAGSYATIAFFLKVPKKTIPGETYIYSIESYAKSQTKPYANQLLTVITE
ncbi:MAG: hypothetical protein PHD81_01100 [Candidatus Nanoarchaeia archaeon]|nr:hypothetical protein [Candidatus Nanoarchaeia archaeon]MDD5587687.1 hypothetical protein [Candidatus Nanoarchaeia archaeon]